MSTVNRIPDYIMRKIELANNYAYKAETLNAEVEEWMESHGCECGFDALFDYREPHGEVTRITREELLEILND